MLIMDAKKSPNLLHIIRAGDKIIDNKNGKWICIDPNTKNLIKMFLSINDDYTDFPSNSSESLCFSLQSGKAFVSDGEDEREIVQMIPATGRCIQMWDSFFKILQELERGDVLVDTQGSRWIYLYSRNSSIFCFCLETEKIEEFLEYGLSRKSKAFLFFVEKARPLEQAILQTRKRYLFGV